jgi:hypothetical protein
VPEQLNLRVGDSFPTMPFRCRPPAGQVIPSLSEAIATMRARRVGGGELIVLRGDVTIREDSGAIVGEYVPDVHEGLEVAEYFAECSVALADGRSLTIPFSEAGVSRYFRINVTDVLVSVIDDADVDATDSGVMFDDVFGVFF